MDYVDVVIKQIISNFDFAYMFIINVLTYLVIKLIDFLNGDKKVSTLIKRVALIGSIVVVTAIYVACNYPNNVILLNSAILAPVFWSWVMKPIFKKLNIGYKDVDDYMN